MVPSTNASVDTIEREHRSLSTQEVVWMGAPYTNGSTEPTCVELFVLEENAKQYVETIRESSESTREWIAWGETEDGTRLVEMTSNESIGVVSPLQTTVSGKAPPFDGSILESTIPSDSRLRSYLPGVNDPPAIKREAIPFAFFDLILLSERGHLQLQVGAASNDELTEYLDELGNYAQKASTTGATAADDRVARNRIEDLNDYFKIIDATGYYGKPRYRLAKKLSEWGGETGRYAILELWLLFQLVLRLYPEHITWKAEYTYHDEH